jgi:hypothetical protein
MTNTNRLSTFCRNPRCVGHTSAPAKAGRYRCEKCSHCERSYDLLVDHHLCLSVVKTHAAGMNINDED